jgi:competence protein ComEC
MLQRIAAEEAERLALWAPVLFGAGCALGLGPFVLAPLWAGFAAALGFGLLAGGLTVAAARRGGGLLTLAAGIALAAGLVALGVCAAGAKVRAVDGPVAPTFMGVAEIDGWVSGIDRGPSGPRLTLRVARLGALLPEETPHAVRLTLREVAAPAVGAAVRCRAFLQPPPGPVLPGGYDFQRRAPRRRGGALHWRSGSKRPARAPSPPSRAMPPARAAPCLAPSPLATGPACRTKRRRRCRPPVLPICCRYPGCI